MHIICVNLSQLIKFLCTNCDLTFTLFFKKKQFCKIMRLFWLQCQLTFKIDAPCVLFTFSLFLTARRGTLIEAYFALFINIYSCNIVILQIGGRIIHVLSSKSELSTLIALRETYGYIGLYFFQSF